MLQIQSVPTISWESQRAISPHWSGSFSLAGKIESYRRTRVLYEESKSHPIRAKVKSLLAAGLIISVIAGGAVGTYYGQKTLNGGAILGSVLGSVLVTNVAGAYFNYRWVGFEPSPEAYEAFVYMSFLGILIPIWRAFFDDLEKSSQEALARLKKSCDLQFQHALMKKLEAATQSPKLDQARGELQTLFAFLNS